MPVAMGVTRPIFGAVTYVWGLNIRGKCQGRSSRASYFCQGRACWHFGVATHVGSGPLPAASPLCPKFVRRYRLRNTVNERGKFRFSDSFSFGDIKSSISHLVHGTADIWHLTALRVKSLKTWR